jgi:hypothetical protein
MDKAPTFVGIDVSKRRLDIHSRPSGESSTFGYDDESVAALTIGSRDGPSARPLDAHAPAPAHRPVTPAVTNLGQLLWVCGPPGSETAVAAVSACWVSP